MLSFEKDCLSRFSRRRRAIQTTEGPRILVKGSFFVFCVCTFPDSIPFVLVVALVILFPGTVGSGGSHDGCLRCGSP